MARWREWSQRHERRQQFTERNINYFAKYVDDDELRLVQNRHGVHLCPSEAEGFGHTLVEAMSCGAVVITTDGPPMNEMVTPDRGALVRYGRTGRQRLGTNYFVDVDALEKSIVSVMAMPEAEKRALCRRVGATVVPIQRRVLPTESRRAGRERAEQRLRSLAAVSDAHAAALEVSI